ncbi:DEAD/DEAH box helicase [Paenibacillus allorhizosphaerae]|uniref:DEAD-box ATP-dependent RNA helicase CshA n=1 Tax=Paenibacillus allorhizosphaerae TaxID=2849866 RepID=A0ABM8VKV2_9BACL|nr:DEAD/DEAH box helicase [Paenibacillus allorhizosphaerae]CAG7647593.1 DEAD-box ATP-dependent RNA helicase CshA [Paenibacillus allorhizosphaerae]
MSGFASLHIDPVYLKRLQEQDITEPSPIQREAIPPILEGKDVVAQSQTGTGKTLAYALPLLHKIEEATREVQALVLVPTRELGMQIAQTLEQLTKETGTRVQQLIGGASIERQIDKLKLKPQIVVGTPGRIQELVKLRKLKLHGIRTVVVDEVDQVFELGSMQDVEALFKGMQCEKQLLFFSATLPAPIQEVIDRWMRDPHFVRVNPAQRTSETLEHVYFVCQERDKIDTLRRLVRHYNPKAAMVFINATDDIGEAVAKLKYAGLSVEGLYGDSFKQERARAMQMFRAGRFQLLLSTDVAARGLDLPQVTHVFNLDPPVDADHYVHRVGRTGRMGRQGVAVSIITPKEQFIIDKFTKTLGIALERRDLFHGRIIDPEREQAIRLEARKTTARAKTREGEAAVTSEREVRSVPRAEVKPQASSAPKLAADKDRKVTVSSAARQPKAAIVPPAADKRKANRERDRKNKGAPRWLKEKQNQSEKPRP